MCYYVIESSFRLWSNLCSIALLLTSQTSVRYCATYRTLCSMSSSLSPSTASFLPCKSISIKATPPAFQPSSRPSSCSAKRQVLVALGSGPGLSGLSTYWLWLWYNGVSCSISHGLEVSVSRSCCAAHSAAYRRWRLTFMKVLSWCRREYELKWKLGEVMYSQSPTW